MKIFFGDLPLDAQQMLTSHLRIDFSSCSFAAPRWFAAWARNEKGYVTGIFAAEFQTWFEAKITVLVLDQRCCSRRVLRAIFTALFSKAKRLTAEVEPDNVRSLRQVQRLGFRFEGHHPLGLEGCRDTVVFGMLKDECPWLRSHVLPVDAGLDKAHRRLMDTVVGSDGTLRPRVGTDRDNLKLGKLGVGPVLPVMRQPFGEVLPVSSPTDVVRADATPGATRVRSNGTFRWFAMLPDADETMDAVGLSSRPYVGIPVASDSMRPEQAVVAGVGERSSQRQLRS